MIRIALWTSAFLTVLYALVFWIAEAHRGPSEIVLSSLSNAIPQVWLAIPLIDRLPARLKGRGFLSALPVTMAAVMLYAIVSYCAVIFLLALINRVPSNEIILRFFSGPALPWQMLQGVAYGCVAVFAGLWLSAREQLGTLNTESTGPDQQRQRWLVKTANGIEPIDAADIVRIEAAGEYSRLVLPNRALLSRIGMSECEQRLAGLHFLRVHRSHLINSDAIVHAEPAGNGRLQLTFKNGDQIVTSRDGSKLVRAGVI
jgi:hypothetical protein